MNRRTSVLMTTAAAAALLGLAAPAVAIVPATTSLGASEGVRYKKMTTALPKDDSAEVTTAGATAFCDEGWVPVGGGQSMDPAAHGGISDSWVGQEKYWFTAAWQAYDIETPLTTFATCMKTDGVSESKMIASNLAADLSVTRSVQCAQGAAVSGGVFKTGDTSDFRLNASYPVDGDDADTVPDDGWRSYVDYMGDGGDSIHFTVHCLEGAAISYRTATFTLKPNSWTTGKARCPKGSAVVGGGAYVSGTESGSRLYASKPWDGKDAGKVPEDGWRVGSYNTSPNSLTMKVHAVCKSGA